MSIRDTLRQTIRALGKSSPTPALDAEVLLAFALGAEWSRERLAMHPEMELTPSAARRFAALLRRRLRGEPVAYLRGFAEFYGLPFQVNRHVLIPRPESEAIVEAALAATGPTQSARIADIGTGSGCLAVAIAKHRPQAQLIATDQSVRALSVARANARRNHVHVTFRRGDLLAALKNFHPDILVANLPYVTTAAYRARQQQLRFEPRHALRAGQDGLALYRRFLRQTNSLPQLPKKIIIELESSQVRALRRLGQQLKLPYAIAVHRINNIAIVSLNQKTTP